MISEGYFEGNQSITMAKQFQTLCLEKPVLKNISVGLHEATRGYTKSKTDHCDLLPINNLYVGYIKGLGKETVEFFHHVLCGKLGNITQIDKMSILILQSLC